jgi:hypothetical protein
MEQDTINFVIAIASVAGLILFVACTAAILKIPKIARASAATMKMEALRALREGENPKVIEHILNEGTDFKSEQVELILKSGKQPALKTPSVQ